MKNTVMLLIQESRFKELKSIIDKINVVDIADLFEQLKREQIIIVFRLLTNEKAAELFAYLSRENQQFIIESISDKEIKSIINELFIDDTVDFLEEMPASVVSRVLRNTDEQTRVTINQFLTYPTNSAGSLMTNEYVDLHKEMTVAQSIDYIKRNGIDKETIDNCYVTGAEQSLEGTVSIRRLILSDSDVLVRDIMVTDIVKVNTFDDQEDIAELFKKYDLSSMPVVDKSNCLVGIITVDDILDIIEKENTEDFLIMAAVTPSEEEYVKTPVLTHVKNRVVWLLILMISATVTGAVISKYEDILGSILILASFIPMLMDTGGNCGSQSSTLIIRSLALGEISFKDTFTVFWKELRISIVVGLILALVNFGRIMLMMSKQENILLIATVVSMTLFGVVVISKLIGGLLPIFAKKVRMDPAVMASPLITTVVDAMALVLFFGLSNVFLHSMISA